MSITHHAARRESPLARLTRLARRQAPATGIRTYLQGPPFAREEHHADQRYIATAPMPIATVTPGAPASLAETEPWGSWDVPTDLYMNERDEYVNPERPYLPYPDAPAPDLCADLADLPAFRDALSRRTRCRAGECLCGHQVTGETWGERMVRAGIHLLAGAA